MILLRVIVVSLLLAGGQILLKVAMPPSARTMSLPNLIWSLVSTWCFWAACMSTTSAAVLWTWTLASAPVSAAYPLMVSLSLVFVLLAGTLLLEESIGILSYAGVAVIIAGIWLVTLGNG